MRDAADAPTGGNSRSRGMVTTTERLTRGEMHMREELDDA
jgi:hypothetical protein